MKITNNNGREIDPCGTPVKTSVKLEKLLFITTLCFPSFQTVFYLNDYGI